MSEDATLTASTLILLWYKEFEKGWVLSVNNLSIEITNDYFIRKTNNYGLSFVNFMNAQNNIFVLVLK